MGGPQLNVKVNLEPMSQLLDVCQKLADAVLKVGGLAKETRSELRRSISTTCELIDSVLTAVKQRLGTISVSLRAEIGKGQAADYAAICSDVARLRNAPEWESRYRQVQLCEPLRSAASELRDTFFGRFKALFALSDADHLQGVIDQFLEGEYAAGQFVSHVLEGLADLDTKVSEAPEMVLSKIEEGRASVQTFRDHFIDLEKKMSP